MVGSHFDTFVRTLATRPLTRAQTLHGLAVGVVATLTGLSVFTEAAAKNKGKKKRRRKKKPVCTCFVSGCTQQKVTKPSSLINQNPRCNYAGACTTNPCAGTCSPATNTQGTCQPGQLCSPLGNCVAGCTTTTDGAQGSCPAGQVCRLGGFVNFEIPPPLVHVELVPPITGQCQTAPV